MKIFSSVFFGTNKISSILMQDLCRDESHCVDGFPSENVNINLANKQLSIQ